MVIADEEQDNVDCDNNDNDETDLIPPSNVNRNSNGDLILTPDDFDDFVTSCNDPDLFVNDISNINQHQLTDHDAISNLWDTTNAGEFAYAVQGDEEEKKGAMKDITINGHVILNQCGCLLTRKRHMIKGNKKHNYFIQKLCAISVGSSIPLMYPEAMLFPSIFWKSVDESLAIAGAIPAPLLSESISSTFGFAFIPDHVCSRLSNPSMNTSTDFHYTSFC